MRTTWPRSTARTRPGGMRSGGGGGAVGRVEGGGESRAPGLVGRGGLERLRAGAPGEEIAVVYRPPQRSAPLIERVFPRYGVGVAREGRVGLASTALGRALLA